MSRSFACSSRSPRACFAAPAQAAVLVTIDKSVQQMTVAVDGRPLYQWPVSTGKAGYDTPNGKFKAFRMERDHYSKEWDEAPMPFSIFFTQKGHAIHGSLDVKRLGSPASHGCVRLLPANAEKLFALVEQEGVLNTTVVLTGVAPSGAPAVARRAPRPDAEQAYAQPQYGQQQYVSSVWPAAIRPAAVRPTAAPGLWPAARLRQSVLRPAAVCAAAICPALRLPPRATSIAIPMASRIYARAARTLFPFIAARYC